MMRPLIKLRAGGVVAAVLLWLTPQLAAAQQIPAPVLRYQIGWQDLAVTGGALALTAVPIEFAAHLPHATCAPCDPSHLWGIDRHFVGEPRGGPGKASTATMMLAVFAGGALVLDAHEVGPGNARYEDLAVYAQALAVNAALTSWSKVLFHRPRPPRYTANGTNYTGVDEGLSFPSGHTSVAFTAAAAYTSILRRQHAAGSHAGEVALLFGAAAATGVLRVAAHRHFPTDVVAGAALGTAVGWFVPQMHPVR